MLPAEVAARPQWTEKLYPPSQGQDHLGLGSVSSDQILPKLSPGIVVQTVHPRYWSFYTFLLDEFWQRDLPRTRRDFSRFYRPREAIFAAGCHLCDRPEHDEFGPMQAIVGSVKSSALVHTQPSVYDAQFNYIKDALGGYGLYYSAAIAGMGLTLPATPAAGLPYDAPTPEGRALAGAYRTAIADTRYYRDYFDDDHAQVPAEVVAEYIRAGCLCQLRTPTAPDRALLQDVFLHAGGAHDSAQRRSTMRMFLDLAEQTAGHELSEDRFRRLTYFHSTGPDGAAWEPAPPNVRTARRWRLYQAREYYAYALNRMWRYLAEWGIGQVPMSGDVVPIARWWDFVDHALDFAPLAAALEVDDSRLDATSTVAELAQWASTSGNVAGGLDDSWDVAAPVTEHRLYRWADSAGDDPAVVPGALTLLALVACRVGSRRNELAFGEDWDICRDGGVSRLALSRFFNQWRDRQHLSLSEAARWVLGDYVIRQHERVAVAKLAQNGDTFRFRRQGDYLRFYDAFAPARMSNSRFQALATTVYELGFVDSLYGATHTLTDAGRRLLADGDLPERHLQAAMNDGGNDG
ncbi:MAG TPA: hypothetical protein VFA11_05120 [Acidimicrobiales bacterium]|nr:hypothetical protein [Acidimicrobiales bacterium]